MKQDLATYAADFKAEQDKVVCGVTRAEMLLKSKALS